MCVLRYRYLLEILIKINVNINIFIQTIKLNIYAFAHIKINTYLNSMTQENIIGNTNNKFHVKFEIA